MPAPLLKNFNLPWHQHDDYWLALYPKTGDFSILVQSCLEKLGLRKNNEESMSIRTGRNWNAVWQQVYAGLESLGALEDVEVALAPDMEGLMRRVDSECRTPAAIQVIADSMWLGDALIEDRVMCYLQPVIGGNEKTFGYESFARAKAIDGRIVGGDKIIAASKVLGIEYMIDRMLHVEAIKTFVSSEFNGFLFVNFFPGFIHRPSVYLEGLSDTAKSFGVVAKHIVLDFTNSETPRDLGHLNNVCDYARSRGYSIALDDISSIDTARKLIPEIRPDFVKIDMQLVRKIDEPGTRETIRALIEISHEVGSMVIAEGVETKEAHQALKLLGVDLFQGYLFSPPVPVETALARTGTLSS